MSDIIIREAVVADAPTMASIHVRTWQSAYADIMPADFLKTLCEEKSTAFWIQELSRGKSINRVAMADSQIVGWASGGPCRDQDSADSAEIYAIYVSPESQGRGTGKQLMQRLTEDLSQGSDIVLWVLEQNHSAIGFYAQLGYTPDGATKTLRIGGRELVEIRFRK